MATLAVTSSATLNAVAGYPNMESPNIFVHKGTVVNNEVLTIVHGKDVEGFRDVLIINSATGVDAPTAAVVARATSESTTVTFGAAAAGSYIIKIRLF